MWQRLDLLVSQSSLYKGWLNQGFMFLIVFLDIDWNTLLLVCDKVYSDLDIKLREAKTFPVKQNSKCDIYLKQSINSLTEYIVYCHAVLIHTPSF